MPRKYGLALEPLNSQERQLILRFLNRKIPSKQLLDSVKRNIEKQVGQKRKKKTGPSLVIDLPGFKDRTEEARKWWYTYVRGAGRNPGHPGANYWAVWISFDPFRVAASTPGDYLGLLLTRAMATGQIKRFVRCEWEDCRKFEYMSRARPDMRFCSIRCKNQYHWYTRKLRG